MFLPRRRHPVRVLPVERVSCSREAHRNRERDGIAAWPRRFLPKQIFLSHWTTLAQQILSGPLGTASSPLPAENRGRALGLTAAGLFYGEPGMGYKGMLFQAMNERSWNRMSPVPQIFRQPQTGLPGGRWASASFVDRPFPFSPPDPGKPFRPGPGAKMPAVGPQAGPCERPARGESVACFRSNGFFHSARPATFERTRLRRLPSTLRRLSRPVVSPGRSRPRHGKPKGGENEGFSEVQAGLSHARFPRSGIGACSQAPLTIPVLSPPTMASLLYPCCFVTGFVDG